MVNKRMIYRGIIKLFFLLLIIFPAIVYSQNKKGDVYFIVNKKDDNYTLGNKNYLIKKYKTFTLYDKVEYEKRQHQIQKEKKEGRYYRFTYYGKVIPNSLIFNIRKESKVFIQPNDIGKLNIVGYKWVLNNSWKENNPNILFNDLYFLLKVKGDQYLKFKVERTLIAH